MTRFEERGVRMQESARSPYEAVYRFKFSCSACEVSPYCANMDCDHCAIKMAHEREMAAYAVRGKLPIQLQAPVCS